MNAALKLLAPYIAVVFFWCVWPNAWLAILAYHTQILFWNRPSLRGLRLPSVRRRLLLVAPLALTGPLLYALLPIITRTDLTAWLATYHLSGLSLVLMIPYFGLVHPILEQVHWRPFRENNAWSHVVFAGYHMIVLSSLLTTPWLIFCFVVLAGASFAWKLMTRAEGSLTLAALSHILADLGVVVAVWLRVTPMLF